MWLKTRKKQKVSAWKERKLPKLSQGFFEVWLRLLHQMFVTTFDPESAEPAQFLSV